MKLAAGDHYAWNWAAFVFCWHWLVFRKLYTFAMLFALLPITLDIITIFFFDTAILKYDTFSSGLFIRCGFGISANLMYFMKFKKALQKPGSSDTDSPADSDLHHPGGVNWILASATFLLFEALPELLSQFYKYSGSGG